MGENVITIEVTAEDGQTTKTYSVTITRAAAPEPTAAIELSSDSVEEGKEISVTMSFANLTPDSQANLEVWPESHWPRFLLIQADVFPSYIA